MALDTTNFNRISNGTAKVFLYHTTDAIATVVAANYFLDTDIQPGIDPNDVIIAVCSTGGTRTVDVLVVATSTAAGVTVINGT